MPPSPPTAPRSKKSTPRACAARPAAHTAPPHTPPRRTHRSLSPTARPRPVQAAYDGVHAQLQQMRARASCREAKVHALLQQNAHLHAAHAAMHLARQGHTVPYVASSPAGGATGALDAKRSPLSSLVTMASPQTPPHTGGTGGTGRGYPASIVSPPFGFARM
eukprot:1458829-Prymnesium_polylepis.1